MAGLSLLGTAALLALVCGCAGIRMLYSSIGQTVVRGSSLTLICLVDPEDKKIYQAKWYKDGKEFYHYQPGAEQPMVVFPVNGTSVNMEKSSGSRVVLEDVDLDTSGKYGCEVTTEVFFDTVMAKGNVSVVELPRRKPYISTSDVIKRDAGDIIGINCTSEKSRPAVNLTWYINGDKTGISFITRYPVVTDELGLETVTLGLHFPLRETHFRHDRVTLKCLAELCDVHHASHEVQVRRRSLAQRASQQAVGQPGGAGSRASSHTSLFVMLSSWTFLHALETKGST